MTMTNLEFLEKLFPALIYCTLCGGIIGFERGRKGAAAGMKTQIFICVGAAIFTFCSMAYQKTQGAGDAVRTIAQIASGVGFLGAGTIMARDRIVGLTTASIIWVMAGLGVMIGIGYGPAALAITVGMVVIIQIISRIENRFIPHHHIEENVTVDIHMEADRTKTRRWG